MGGKREEGKERKGVGKGGERRRRRRRKKEDENAKVEPRPILHGDPPSSSKPRPLQCRSTVKHWRRCEVVEARGLGWEGVGVRAYSNR